MGITVIDYNKLIEKAKTRKDGVYSHSPYLYVVKDHKFIAYSDFHGNVFRALYGFTTQIGKVDRHDRRNKLLEFLKSQ